jgi:hypothetical protein
MLPKPESASFVIADISGYTSFLHGAELDHAQDIIADVVSKMALNAEAGRRLSTRRADRPASPTRRVMKFAVS